MARSKRPSPTASRASHPAQGGKLTDVLYNASSYKDARLPSSRQRTTESSLRLVEDAVRGSKVGLWSRDFTTDSITYSPEWKALLGYAPAEIDSTHAEWEDRLHPEDRARVLETLKACFDGRLPGCARGSAPAYESTYRMRHKDGSYRWILARGTCERDARGQLERITGSHVDITALKTLEQEAATGRQQADEMLAANELVFRTVFSAAGVGLAISNRDGLYLSVNSAFCALTGYAEHELIGRSWTSLTHADYHDEVQRRRQEVLDDSVMGAVVEKRHWTKWGQTVWIRNQYCYLPEQPGQAACLLIIAEDVTRRREADEALRRSVGELRSLAGRLQRIREEERTRLAREIHDEFGQALTSMKLDAAALSMDLSDEPRRRAEAIMDLADRSIESMRRIATDLRPGVLDDLGLVAALEWAVEEFQSRVGIPCRVIVPDVPIELTSEKATALFRILQESLTNIARHAQASAVSIRLFAGADGLTLQIRDNGVGFAESDLATGQSLGILGMRERALILGGMLTIRSSADDGTLLTVRIPKLALPAAGGTR